MSKNKKKPAKLNPDIIKNLQDSMNDCMKNHKHEGRNGKNKNKKSKKEKSPNRSS